MEKKEEPRTMGLPRGSVHPSFNMGDMTTLFKIGTRMAEFVGQSQIYFSKMGGFIWAQWILKI